MKRFKDIISKPSEALQAMVDGLLDQSKREDFRIDMYTFGNAERGICYGCAATCAVMQLSGVKLNIENIEEHQSHEEVIPFKDTLRFEIAINMARCGELEELFIYFDIPIINLSIDLLDGDFFMVNDNWVKQIPYVNEHIKKLQAAGY